MFTGAPQSRQEPDISQEMNRGFITNAIQIKTPEYRGSEIHQV